MHASDVCAVIVSFNGGASLKRAVSSIIGQVGSIHIVDNGSDDASCAILRQLACQPDLRVTFLGDNFGIAAALNVGVKWARSAGYTWVLTLDQDSTPESEMIAAYQVVIHRDPSKYLCLAPAVRGLKVLPAFQSPVESVDSAITSGNLVSMRVFDLAGEYDESLFIDCVDFDFSLRVRAAGIEIFRVKSARMNHELGGAGGSSFVLPGHTVHSPVRRYYMFRNCLYLARRHWRRFPFFVFKLLALQAVQAGTIVIQGPDRAHSLRLAARGIVDFFGCRAGRIDRPQHFPIGGK